MKRGFTLIELLSVIVVLAIISVIAIPTLIGVVNKVKLQSLRSSAYGLIEAGTLYNAQYGNTNNARFDIMNNVVTTTEENKIKYKGSVKQGTVIVSTKGKVSVCVTDGKNSAYKNYNDTEVTLVSKKTCSVPANTAVIYLDGEATIDSVDAKNILDRIDHLEEKVDGLNVSSVKRVFRGTFSMGGKKTTIITLPYSINPEKSHVELYGIGWGQGTLASTTGIYVSDLSSTELTIKSDWTETGGEFSWEITEYN